MPAPLHSLATAQTPGVLATFMTMRPCGLVRAINGAYHREPDPGKVEGRLATKPVSDPCYQLSPFAV